MSKLTILNDIIKLADERNLQSDSDASNFLERNKHTPLEPTIEKLKLENYLLKLSDIERLYVATVMFGGKERKSGNEASFERIYGELMTNPQNILQEILDRIPALSLFLSEGIKAFKIEETSRKYL